VTYRAVLYPTRICILMLFPISFYSAPMRSFLSLPWYLYPNPSRLCYAAAASSPFTTYPTTLYLLLKNVFQSSSVFFFSSSKSSHSALTSSAFVEVSARARDASWPANTIPMIHQPCPLPSTPYSIPSLNLKNRENVIPW
jgi:hypothetical protein